MRIKTSYDCEIEPRDLANLQQGHRLSATLSDGSVAFTFRMDPTLLQNGPSPVRVVGEKESPRLLTDGTVRSHKYQTRGVCPYCGAGPVWMQPHIRAQHPGKPVHPTGKFHCPQCPQRFVTENGMKRHVHFTHAKKAAKKKAAPKLAAKPEA